MNTGTIYPKIQHIKIGHNAEFFCESNNPVQWKFNGGNLPSNAVASKSTFGSKTYSLRIYNATPNNTGTYNCHGEYQYYSIFIANSSLHVSTSNSKKSNSMINELLCN